MSSGTSEEEDEMKVTGGFGQEVDAATLKANISMASAEDQEESKNEGTSLTEKMAKLDLKDAKEESKKPQKKKATKKPAATTDQGKGPTTRSRARLQAFLAQQQQD